jgi:hypothetical protein
VATVAILNAERVCDVFSTVIVEPTASDQAVFQGFVGATQDRTGIPEALSFAKDTSDED